METGMGHSLGDGIIVVALAAIAVAYMYFKHMERRRRLEVLHQERLVAMEKGIPLPELPLEAERGPSSPSPKGILLHGIVWTALSAGAVVGLWLIPNWPGSDVWPLVLPLLFLGIGLILYYALASDRRR